MAAAGRGHGAPARVADVAALLSGHDVMGQCQGGNTVGGDGSAGRDTGGGHRTRAGQEVDRVFLLLLLLVLLVR